MNVLIIVVFAFISTPSSALNLIMKIFQFDSQKMSQMNTVSDSTIDPLVRITQNGSNIPLICFDR